MLSIYLYLLRVLLLGCLFFIHLPLLIHTAQEDSARYLIDYGAPVGVFDDTGMSAIGCMVEKMPHVALEALDQFRSTDPAFRKDFYYLNYLEYDPAK